jgi:integrase/recombinase XerD
MSATGFLWASVPVVDVVIFGVSMKLVMLEESMQVQRVVMPGSGVSSWTVLGDDDVPVGPIERYLTYLTDIDRSPNTVKAYAHDLKDYWGFLRHRGLDWREVRLEDIGEYVAWLSLPPPGRAGRVAVLPSVQPHVAASTTNRKLSGAVGVLCSSCPAWCRCR